MNWKELTPNNIEEIKELYTDYLTKSNSKNTLNFEDFLEDLDSCSICGSCDLIANLFDTETLPNGGINLVCESCLGDMK